ncbi:DNA mismatch repair protein MutL [Thermosporothrix hazakensis]|jgi:DNA mismatch repair protein MutL|uniref:DNA mismatch repair protein MutL n=1 Tax=Thermosporothrix hazakensis TaxID=644383 RepID=A0A326U2N7_THEHA|nr:DNA mismatch repair endonuclease MutL [Thermosporothrix hazakensis]PZW24691.1 DNA mismatch repair protein MutL [Thermosporothrix hazakensis]GCE48363.1 DNA mismatch repair protein MutL [Thermosporothrix hazakensis]
MPIRQLAPDVAAKIAAGEVVERPASVVKELIENSIDAGSTQIRVDLMHGGLQLIRVTDNGCGITADELPLALSRHATSKVASIDDLENIRSLGFRGEALASIAAVADVSLQSRPRDAEHGAQIQAQNGRISEVTPAAVAVGTTITVRNLFSAVPARLKFLKSRNTEVSHCLHLLEQYALAYPEIRFMVFSENRQVFATPGDGKLFSVLVEVYGLQIAQQMVPVDGDDEHDDDTDYPLVQGYTSRPSCYKSTRQHISFFVNRRWVMSRVLTAAVENAYHSLLLAGRHPLAVMNIQIDPALLDVNVHPAKTEIRFLKERRVYASILRAVRKALLADPQLPQWQPKSAPEPPKAREKELPVEEEEPTTEQPLPTQKEETTFPADSPWITFTEEETGTKPPLLSRLWQGHVRVTPQEKPVKPAPVEEPKQPEPTASRTAAHAPSRMPPTLGITLPEEITSVPSQEELPPVVSPPPVEVAPVPVPAEPIALPVEPVVRPVETALVPERPVHFPKLRVIGQLAQSYIVTEGPDGMYLIDQHAAHERILLERMVANWKARTPLSQLLLTPIEITLAPTELEALEEHRAQLEHIGFALAIEDGKTVSISAVPDVLVKRLNKASLQELLVELTAEENLGHTETWEEQALANVACKAAIKQNYFLTVAEMREMIEQLQQTKAPFSCCHGRPTMINFGLSALAHEFERR